MVKLSVFVLSIFFLFSEFVLLQTVSAQQYSSELYLKEAVALKAAINKNYYDSSNGFYRELPVQQEQKNQASYLWPLCALLQAANELEAFPETAGYTDSIFQIIRQYYDPKEPAPGYASYPPVYGGGDRFYDDNQWVGISLLDAYERTKNQLYLSKGREIYRFMMTGYDTLSGGGLYWEEGKPTKNTCSNGPGILLALQLYKATGEKSFLDTATMLFDWVNKKLVDENGLYFDNINTANGRLDKRRFSYNTGTMMQSAVYLYEITGNNIYLDRAKKTADAAAGYFYGSGKFRDNLWFNAVMLRAILHLRKVSGDDRLLNAFKACVDHELRLNKNAVGLIGKEKLTGLVGQGGMLEILARLAALH